MGRSFAKSDSKTVAPSRLWERHDRRFVRFSVRIAVAVLVGVGWAGLRPMVAGYAALADAKHRASMPIERWPTCRHMTWSADGCWYVVVDRDNLTFGQAAAGFGMSAERLAILNPTWRPNLPTPPVILVWRGDISRGGT